MELSTKEHHYGMIVRNSSWLGCHLGKRIARQLVADTWQIIEYMGGEHLCLHSISQNDEVSCFGQVGMI